MHPDDFRKRFQVSTDSQEKIPNPLWDKKTYLSATPVTRLLFFDVIPANPTLGNNKGAQTVPANHIQEITGIAVHMDAAIFAAAGAATNVVNDLVLIMRTGILELEISSKAYLSVPLWLVLGGSGIWQSIGYAGAEAANEAFGVAQGGRPDPNAIYRLKTILQLPSQQPFSVRMIWPANLTLTGNVDITVLFDGNLYRPVV